MKSITIHNLDNSTSSLIQKKAKKNNLSLNKTIKDLLAQALGINKNKATDNTQEFNDLCGVWNDGDVKTFKKNISDLEKINLKDWQ